MFFRREKPRQLSFDDHISNLKKFGFEIQQLGHGKVKALRQGCAVIVEDGSDGAPGRARFSHIGLAVGDEIAPLVDGGFQKFFVTSKGRKIPALAVHLRNLHDFNEDLKEALGIASLYNESLGSTFNQHLYDRVKDRDHGVPTRPWQDPAIRVE